MPSPTVRLHLAAQVEDGQPQLGDDPGQLAAQRLQVGLQVGDVPRPGGEVVDDVAQRGELLGDPVVDLPGQPAALLGGGQAADLAEQQRRLQPQPELLEDGLGGRHLSRVERCVAALERHQAERAQPDPQRQDGGPAGGARRQRPGGPHRAAGGPGLVEQRAVDVPVQPVGPEERDRGQPAAGRAHVDGPPVERRLPADVLEHLLGQRHRVQAAGQLSGHQPQLGDQAVRRRVGDVLRLGGPAPAAGARPRRPGAPRPA